MKVAFCDKCKKRLPGELWHGPPCQCPGSEKITQMWEKIGEATLGIPASEDNDLTPLQGLSVLAYVERKRRDPEEWWREQYLIAQINKM